MEDSPRARSWCGWCGCLVGVLLLVAIVYPVIMPHPHHPRLINCINNLKQISAALAMYTNDWGESYPPVSTRQRVAEGKAWPDYLMSYIKNERVFRCPKAKDRLTYAFNRRLSGLHEGDVTSPGDVIMVFESVSDSPKNNNLNGDKAWRPRDSRRPRSGTLVIWPRDEERLAREWPKWARPRHEEANNIVYADSHVKSVTGMVDDRWFSPELPAQDEKAR